MAIRPTMTDERWLYKRQIKEKACTVCRNVGRGGKGCKECGKNGKNWKNAFVDMINVS